MAACTLYLLESLAFSGVLLGYYWVFLRTRNFYQFNRFFLLGVFILSTVVPLVHIPFPAFSSQTIPLFLPVIRRTGPAFNAGYSGIIPAFSFWWHAGGAISVILLLVLSSRIIWIYHLKRIHTCIKKPGYTLVETELESAPFCFLNNLFWRVSISSDNDKGRNILIHELTHIQQKHTYDKLLVQILVSVFWINPFYWLARRELNLVHEFIADSRALDQGDSQSFAKMLLHSYDGGKYLMPTNSFFTSPIKRRLAMIISANSQRSSRWRQILVIPTIISLFLLSTYLSANAQTPVVTLSSYSVSPHREKDAGKVPDHAPSKDAPNQIPVNVQYTNPNGVSTILSLPVNFQISSTREKNEPKAAAAKQDMKEVWTDDATNQLIRRIVQDPPDIIYLVNGKETPKSDVKSLNAGKVKTIDILKGDEAVRKYGEKARKGIIILTTAN